MKLTTEELDQAWLEAMNCTGYENTVTDTEYRLDINSETKTVIVSFQGSGSKLDWKQNFTFWKKAYKHMNKVFFVHKGLFNKYKSVKSDIWNIILPVLNPDWKIRAYGFSQGATLVTFFHEDAKFRLPNIDIKTFAFAPAKGFTFWNFKLLKTRFKTLYTIINYRDIVPKVPLLIQGFIHYGNKIKLGKWKLILFPWNWVKEHLGYRDLF